MENLSKGKFMTLIYPWFCINLQYKSMQSLVSTSKTNRPMPLRSIYKLSSFFTNSLRCLYIVICKVSKSCFHSYRNHYLTIWGVIFSYIHYAKLILLVQPSSYFNEKAITSVHIKRLECLCKIYFYVFDNSKKPISDSSVLQELQDLYSPLYIFWKYI